MPVKPQVALLPTLRVTAGTSMRLYVQNLFTALDRHGEVAVKVAEPPCGRDDHAGPWRGRWLRYVRYPQWCRQVRADLYHITDHANAQLLLVLPSARTVVTCHDLYPVAVTFGALRYPGSDSPAVLLASALRLKLLRGAGALVCISHHTLGECSRFLGMDRRRMFLAYYGVDDLFRIAPSPRCLAEFRRKHGLDENTLHLLHVGSTDPRKNLAGVLRVLARVRSRLARRVRLVRIGPAFPQALEREAHALGLSEDILHLGELKTEQIALAYRACDVLVYPSYHEGFCRPVTEAQASGLPVVTSNRGAIPELVEDPRLCFDPEDTEGMARCVCLLVGSTEFAAEVAERGQRAMQRFTWTAHAEAVVEAYRFLLSQGI